MTHWPVCCVEDRIMDSGASFHATYCKEELERFKLRSSKVRLADDKTLDIAGVEDVVLKTLFGISWTLKDVRYIPCLKRRLISVGQLDKEGYHHQRLDDMSRIGMSMLASKGNVPDVRKVDIYFCKPGGLGKQKKLSFIMSEKTRKLQKLKQVLYMMSKAYSWLLSIGRSHYYVTFIDDSSRKVWVYFLKNKSEVFNTFKKWKAAVENETNLRVKCLKSDNGGEYSSRDFIEYCAENGIRMLKTVPETPQQNGVAERMNRTLNERAKSMRLHAGLPKMFWEDSVTMAAYLINRGPSVPLEFRILAEEWEGKEVSLAHLRVFGCDSYVKVKDVARDKLDAKSVKCTFIGYGSDEMGYRFWDSKSHKVVRSRDVTFNEDQELREHEVRAEAPKMLWADSVSTDYLIYCIPYVPIGLRILEEEWRGKDTSLIHLKVFGCDSFVKVKDVSGEAIKCTFIGSGLDEVSVTDSSSLTKPIQKSQVVLVDIPENLAENDSIVAEHGLSSEITQSPGESSDTSKGSKNSRSFEDSGRSDEEYSKDGASSKEGGSETLQVQRSTRESRAPVRYSPLANYLLLIKNGEPEFYSETLSSKEFIQWKKAINEEMVSLKKNQTCSLVRLPTGKKASQSLWMFRVQEEQDGKKRNDTSTQHKSEGFQLAGQKENLKCRLKEILYGLIQAPRQWLRHDRIQQAVLIFVEASWNKEHCSDVHQVSDEIEVEVLRSFNWPPSELITEDGVLPERGYSQFNDVSSGYLVSKVS
ncbi:retrovirus-related pol polyprotein from transposon TNT 1-94 [Tanacetum coccineum]